MAETKIIEDNEAGELVTKYWSNYRRNTLDTLTTKWEDLYEKYRSYLREREDLKESNLFVPRSFDSVETALPRLILALHSVKPPFQAMPIEAGDVVNAKKLTSIIDYYNEITNFFMDSYRATKITSILGTSVIKEMWNPALQRPARTIILPSDFLVDNTAMSIEEAEYAGDRHIRSLTYLRMLESRGIYKNIDMVEKEGKAYSGGDNDLKTRSKSIYGLTSPYHTKANDKETYYEVIECYHNNKTQVTTTAGGITIRNDKNELAGGQDFPYAPIYITPDIMDFYGIGIVEPIRHLQEQLNDFTNGIMTRLNRSVAPITLAAGSEWENMNTWIFGSGKTWKVNDINGLKFETLPPLPPEFFAVLASINGSIDKTNALGDYARGVSSGQESATGASILAQAADSRFKLQVYMLQNGFKRAIKLQIKNIQEFMPSELVVRLLGTSDFDRVAREDILGERDIMAAGTAEIVSKETKRAQLVNLMNVLFRPEVYAKMVQEGYMLNLNKIISQIFENYEMKDLPSMITKLPQMQPTPSATPSTPPTGGEQQVVDIGTPNNIQEALKQVSEQSAPLQTNSMAGL